MPMDHTSPAALTYEKVNRDILRTLEPPTVGWYLLFLTAFSCMLCGAFCWHHQVIHGIGMSGINNPIGWGVYITDFVFWVGIAHSDTLVSAGLFVCDAQWRCPMYRTWEAMTVFDVAT